MKSTIESQFDRRPSASFLSNLIDFIESDGTCAVDPDPQDCDKLVLLIYNAYECDPEITLCIDYVIIHSALNDYYNELFLLISGPRKDIVSSRLRALAQFPKLKIDLKHIYNLALCAHENDDLVSPVDPNAPFKFQLANLGWNQSDADLNTFLATQNNIYYNSTLLSALLQHKPEVLKLDLETKQNTPTARDYVLTYPTSIWEKMLEHSKTYDEVILDSISLYLSEYKNYAFFDLFVKWSKKRNDKYLPQILTFIERASYGSWGTGINIRRDHYPKENLAETLTKFVGAKYPQESPEVIEVIQCAINASYLPLLEKLTENNHFFYLRNLTTTQARTLADLVKDKVNTKKRVSFWETLTYRHKKAFIPEAWEFICDPSKKLRYLAAEILVDHDKEKTLQKLPTLINSNKSAERLGAIEVLIRLGDQDQLLKLLENKITKAEEDTIISYLRDHKIKIPENTASNKPKKKSKVPTLNDLISAAKKAKNIKLPKGSEQWLKITDLPALKTTKTKSLDPTTLKYILLLQTRSKDTYLSEKLSSLTKIKADNNQFSHHLLDQWLASPMSAKEKWAMPIIDVFADDSIIPKLREPMEGWSEENRGKRGVWAIDAIALIGTEMALQTLYEITQTYRAKRRYLREAAQNALTTAADKLSITHDQLQDRIVPNLGFDSDGSQSFNTTKSEVLAHLQHDYKIYWSTDKDSPLKTTTPSNLTDEAKATLKGIRSELRKQKKLQTKRLELALIEQRHWSFQQWNDLFCGQPLLNKLASKVVWAAYKNGQLDTTFRLYDNGVTATHSGDLIDLNKDNSIGLVHPIELDKKEINHWRKHFTRNKVKPLFAQLTLSVHTIKKAHQNRNKIPHFSEVKILTGNFVKVAKKFDFIRCAISDGGRIPCHNKQFSTTGITATIYTSLHAATQYDEEIIIDDCHFTKNDNALTLAEVPNTILSDVIDFTETLLTHKE